MARWSKDMILAWNARDPGFSSRTRPYSGRYLNWVLDPVSNFHFFVPTPHIDCDNISKSYNVNRFL